MIRTRTFLYFLLAAFTFTGTAHAQPAYPAGYFRNPLDIPILLAGNFGECRPGHFHSGIDIKTGGRENLPVHAAAEGYVSRVKMEPGGFGHGLYITHPNGYTTLYAHLNNFAPALQAYVRDKQYAAESWTVDLKLAPGQFPVKQGDLIAFSGNTGGSTAPHLHFEIRDTKTEHPLNPQLFGFAIKDSRSPVPLRLAIYNRDQSIYNDSPAILALVPKGAYYAPAADTILVYDNTGLGLEVNDFMDGSSNTLAFYTAEWQVDDVTQGRIRLDDIGYDETRYLHAYADYKTKQLRDLWIQCLFRLPGNRLERIYEDMNQDNGQIMMPDNKAHKVNIRLTDNAGNSSYVRFYIKRGRPAAAAPCNEVWKRGALQPVALPNFSFEPDQELIYDDLCVLTGSQPEPAGSFSARHQAGMAYMPAHHYFELRIRPDQAVPFALRSKLALMYSDGKQVSGRAAIQRDKGWYSASVRAFGDYWLAADTSAPVIETTGPWKADQSKAKRLRFKITDAGTLVKTLRGELDGHWLLLEQHGDNWFYELDRHCPKGKHQLTLTATDENGNIARRSFSFTR